MKYLAHLLVDLCYDVLSKFLTTCHSLRFSCLSIGSLFLETGPGVTNWQRCLPEVTSAILVSSASSIVRLSFRCQQRLFVSSLQSWAVNSMFCSNFASQLARANTFFITYTFCSVETQSIIGANASFNRSQGKQINKVAIATHV